jgi:hypothetical protein
LVCEEGIYEVNAISNVSIPLISKTILAQNVKQLERKHECIVQIVIGQIIMLKTIKSKERKIFFL